MGPKIHLVSVFTSSADPEKGGNIAPIVLDASGLSAAEMQSIARSQGHESAFVLPADTDGVDYTLRCFVLAHEMEMCAHATADTTWLLRRLGLLGERALGAGEATYPTQSGAVRARFSGWPGSVGGGGSAGADGAAAAAPPLFVEISQPEGTVKPLAPALLEEVLSVLGIRPAQLHPTLPAQNARTSRAKTVVALRDAAALHGLRPDLPRVDVLCDRLGSTGQTPPPWPPLERRGARKRRQRRRRRWYSPRASGYPEDAATGVAAAALADALRENGLLAAAGEGGVTGSVVVRQGEAMGCPSEIR